MNPSVNFIDLARAARSLPEMTTSQPFAPDSITKRRTPYAALLAQNRGIEVSLSLSLGGGAPTNGANVPTDGEPAEELVTQRFTLCYGGETAVLDLFGVEFERALGELEPLLNEGRELANTPSLLS